ncbi:molybdate ABC transporter substrate-binding protein [Virgibacillus ainsalahensis]
MNTIKCFLILTAALLLIGCGQAADAGENGHETTQLTVSAASSMMESLMEVKEAFEKEHPTIEVTYNFGGSGTLRRQIEQGAPIDFFFSASRKDYEILKNGGFVKSGTAIFENKLVMVKQKKTSGASLEEFLHSGKKLAIGTPEAVPAGSYAREALQQTGAWEQLKGRLVFAKDVSHVLTLVKEGTVAAGMVYASDLYGEEDIAVIEEINPDLHESIEYYTAIINPGSKKNEQRNKAAEAFYHYVQNDKTMKLFHHFGFWTNDRLVDD